VVAAAQTATKEELTAISERGRELALYDAATERAVNALLKAAVTGSVSRSIARQGTDGWIVDFGRLNETRDAFLVAVVAAQKPNTRDFAATAVDPPRAEAGFDLHAALAIETCLRDFGEFEGF